MRIRVLRDPRWLLLSALASGLGCAQGPSPGQEDGGARSEDAATARDAAAPDAAALDAAAPDAAAPDSGSLAHDAGVACENVSGAYIWTFACNPLFALRTTECVVQSGCEVLDYVGAAALRTTTLAGTTLISRESKGEYTVTCTTSFGAQPSFDCEARGTDQPTLNCHGTGVRSTLVGASSYCCDIDRQDCAGGERCASYADAVHQDARFSACISDGTVAEGASCERRTTAGDDNCQAGLYCASFEQPTASDRVCRRLCDKAEDCRPSEGCMALAFAPRTGICRPTCTVGGSDCGSGFTCVPVFPRWGVGEAPLEVGPTCERDGTGNLGDRCTGACGPGLMCVDVDGTGHVCRSLCGPGADCPADERCVPVRLLGIANPSDYGVCKAP